MDTMVHFVIKRTLTKKKTSCITPSKKKKKMKNKRFCTNLVKPRLHLKSNTMEDPLSKDLTHIEK